MTDRKRAYLGLFVAAFLFGVTFVVIKGAVVTLPPFAPWPFDMG